MIINLCLAVAIKYIRPLAATLVSFLENADKKDTVTTFILAGDAQDYLLPNFYD